MNIKQSIESWDEHIRAILDATSIDENETPEQRAARKAELEADPEEWFNYYFSHYCPNAPAPFHKEATRRVLDNPEHYEVRMWSRELAKSTRTMMEVFYLVLVGHTGEAKGRKKKYALLISNSLDNATRLLTPYKLNLEHNRRIIQDYGTQLSSGKWQAAEFTTEKGVSFRALGVGQSPRGTRNEEARPDILLFDDVDTDADCLNQEIVAKKWRWIEEAAIGTRSVSHPTTILFCGNRIAINCCIGLARSFADHHETINIRDEEGNSMWPEKNSETDIDRVLRQKSFAAAQKEYFNNPIREGSVFRQMAYKPARHISEYEHLVCYTDPSYKERGDYKATVLVGLWQKEYHVIKCFVEQATTAAMIGWHGTIAQLVEGVKCHYYMEDVFLQDALRQALNDACRERRLPVSVTGDKRRKQEKFSRIETLLEPLNNNGELYLNEAERYNPHMVRLAEQFLSFAEGSSVHDDAPDAVEGAVWLLQEKASMKAERMIQCFGGKGRNNRW